jgi:hypothetical protein
MGDLDHHPAGLLKVTFSKEDACELCSGSPFLALAQLPFPLLQNPVDQLSSADYLVVIDTLLYLVELLVNRVLVPEPLWVSPLRLVAIGLATALAPVLLLCAGRALLALAARGIALTRDRLSRSRAAVRGATSLRASEPSSRRAPAPLGDEYQSSAGPL